MFNAVRSVVYESVSEKAELYREVDPVKRVPVTRARACSWWLDSMLARKEYLSASR